jgi:hypothetical protein
MIIRQAASLRPINTVKVSTRTNFSHACTHNRGRFQQSPTAPKHGRPLPAAGNVTDIFPRYAARARKGRALYRHRNSDPRITGSKPLPTDS